MLILANIKTNKPRENQIINVSSCFYLFATVNAVLAEDGSAACRHPHSCKRVAIDLVLLNHPLAFLMLKQKQVVTNLWVWILNTGEIFSINQISHLPRKCLHAVHHGSCYAVQWGSCWFESGSLLRRYRGCRYFLSNPAHLQICTPLLGYHWI